MSYKKNSLALMGLVSLLLASVVYAAETPILDPDQPYTGEVSHPVTYDMNFDIVFTPPAKTKVAKVWLVHPQSTVGQTVSDYEVDPAPTSEGVESLYGNHLMYFQFNKPIGAQVIHQHYRLTAYEIHWNIDPSRIVRVEKYPSTFDKYLRSEQSVVVDDPRIQAAAKEAGGGETNPFLILQKVALYVIDHMKYNHNACSLQASSLWALEKGEGHCSDYHGFATALMRANGIPARVAYGINPIDSKKASPSHCKLEVYLAPYGWVNFDISETGKVLSKLKNGYDIPDADKVEQRDAALKRLFSGFRDNTWYRMTTGTDYPLVPASELHNPPLIRTAYIECDNKKLPDPDPSNTNLTTFAWQVVLRIKTDKKVEYSWKY